MGWSEKIDCGANGELVFYWMTPLHLQASKNALTEGSSSDVRIKKGHMEMPFPWSIVITFIRLKRGRGPPKVIGSMRGGTGALDTTRRNCFSSSSESFLEEGLTFDIHKYEETEP